MWLEAGVGALLVLALVQLAILLWLARQNRRLQRQVDALWQNAAVAGTDVPTSMLVAALGRLEHKLGQVQRQPPTSERSWELARQMASAGADIDQLVTSCGLSRDEAKLIVQMRTPLV